MKIAIHKMIISLLKGDFSLPKSSCMDDCLIPEPLQYISNTE